MTRILVLGGGFGGIAAATELHALAPDDEVILVSRDDTFLMGFAKLWDLAGQRPVADGTRHLADLPVRVVNAEITAIDPGSHTVQTSAGELTADGLIVALGARANPSHRQLLDGAGAHDLYDPAALPAMRDALASITSGRVAVSLLGGRFKCPPAPYEAALIVDTLLRERGVRDDVEVVLTTPQPMTLPAAGVDASRYIASHLDDHGVALRERHQVAGITDGQLTFEDGAEPLTFDLLLGVPADAPPAVLGDSGLAGETGWIHPDRHRLTTAFDRVYAIGDCTHIPTAAGALPHAGVFAAGHGRVAAHNLVADLHGGDHRDFDGHGYCFLELPGEQVAFVEGDFYADPMDVALSDADHDQFLRKQAYERDQLAAWFGA
jgi:sulfide:quinone oxidoreductase